VIGVDGGINLICKISEEGAGCVWTGINGTVQALW